MGGAVAGGTRTRPGDFANQDFHPGIVEVTKGLVRNDSYEVHEACSDTWPTRSTSVVERVHLHKAIGLLPKASQRDADFNCEGFRFHPGDLRFGQGNVRSAFHRVSVGRQHDCMPARSLSIGSEWSTLFENPTVKMASTVALGATHVAAFKIQMISLTPRLTYLSRIPLRIPVAGRVPITRGKNISSHRRWYY
ncbi:hypothetical protein BS17DRAFT_763958 [Gyrodon lividus]|nr:hypothetical protein BS17DRAFT_763958 [Gyrodon lividus]